MKMSFRWYGHDDPVTLRNISQIPNMRSIVSAVYDVKPGQVWPEESLAEMKKECEDHGLIFYALDRILKRQYDKRIIIKSGLIAYGITAGFCLLCMLIPSIAGSFVGSGDAGMGEVLIDTLAADRATLLKKDAIRSLIFISCAFGLILWAFRKSDNETAKSLNKKSIILGIAIILLVCFDLFSVGKRYLNKSHFVTPKDFTAHYEPRIVDEIIHQDDDPNYRVLDLSVNTFNDAIQSYHHKCIGGYSPVKLQRYQDLIERYISKEIREFYGMIEGAATIQDIEEVLRELPVVSMLNGKYIIVDEGCSPVYNRFAYGNCWFVDNFTAAANADEEIGLLNKSDLHTTAIIGSDFAWVRNQSLNEDDMLSENDYIELSHYAPNELRYSFSTANPRAAIFSEIYYPEGWKAWIEPAGTYGKVRNGHYQPTAEAKPVELFRANWMLRGAIIPEGEGELIMRFEPESYAVGANISRASSILLILLLLLSIAEVLSYQTKNKYSENR